MWFPSWHIPFHSTCHRFFFTSLPNPGSSSWLSYYNATVAPRTEPKPDFIEPEYECYPGLSIHTRENLYKADSSKDVGEKRNCSKTYAEMPTMTVGISHVSCQHRICKGFTDMESGESPQIFTSELLRRLRRDLKPTRKYSKFFFAYNNLKTKNIITC